MRPGQQWSVASTSKKPPGLEGGQHACQILIRFGYPARCPPAHQPLPTGSEISTRLIGLELSNVEYMLKTFISTWRRFVRYADSTANVWAMSTCFHASNLGTNMGQHGDDPQRTAQNRVRSQSQPVRGGRHSSLSSESSTVSGKCPFCSGQTCPSGSIGCPHIGHRGRPAEPRTAASRMNSCD